MKDENNPTGAKFVKGKRYMINSNNGCIYLFDKNLVNEYDYLSEIPNPLNLIEPEPVNVTIKEKDDAENIDTAVDVLIDEKKESIKLIDEDDLPEEVHKKPLYHMTKKELIDYAKEKYGAEVDETLTNKQIRKVIYDLEKAKDKV